MSSPDLYVTSVGVHLPPVFSIERAVAEGLLAPGAVDADDLCGVRVAHGEPAPEMALRAAREALERSGTDPASLSLILYPSVWHQGPDGWGPQSHLQKELGARCLAVELRHGCTGLFSALILAANQLRAHPDAGDVLVVGAENFGTPLVDRWSMSGADVLIGDGAAAIVLGTRPGFARLAWTESIPVPELEAMHRSGEPAFPPGATTGRPLDFTVRNGIFLREGGMELMRPALADAQKRLAESLHEATGTEARDATRFAYMNTSMAVLEKRILPPLGIAPERTTWHIGRDVGHIGAPDHLVALDRLLAEGDLGAGDTFLMNALGPGMTVAGALLEILETPGWAA